MRQLINRSIQRKTLAIILVTTSVALLVTAAALLSYEARAYREFLIRDLTTQADILARVSAPALAFNDADAAKQSLALLTNRAGIIAGAIYSADGRLFATYKRAGETVVFPPTASAQGSEVVGKDMTLFHPVLENNDRLGSVYLKADYELASRIRDYLLILLGAIVASLLVAALLSLWLQGSVTGPILAIKRVAQNVVQERDFSLRAPKTTSDEIGMLADAFNAMLEEVSERQLALETSFKNLQEETEERRNAEAALRLSNKHKDEFLATLAHELRNPLAPMLNAQHLLRSPNTTTEAATNALEIMGRQLSQMSRLVEDLLDVSRISRGKLVVKQVNVELSEVIDSAIDTVRPLLNSKKLTLSLNLPDQPVHVRADPVRLAQVFSNLLNNARKYTDTGGRISVSAEVNSNTVRVQVRDNGRGISAEVLPRIFTMFTQGDDANTHSQSGLGVGLSLAKRLAELHGGKISAESGGHGKGSMFTVQLPVIQDAGSDHAPVEDQPPVGSASFRILLVDDNVDFVTTLGTLLRDLNHDVRVAHDAPEALDILTGFDPDYAFLDIGLPTMDGFELARKIRARTGDGINLVAISGWAQSDSRHRTVDDSFATYLVKPVELATIVALLAANANSP